ncbi:zinc finger protein CONSTANS-LIKE 3-like [Impatiens glandulifera]|uniref:zinc finger protein CONSTANS-LIKE 3-like n=1 Tax=Impatiens glandulifera TaxID=253017 RepID=UPI001FB1830A|nr:zinc finger protein CONSTANS-LIKE 3-like [Impatiens glandulifera]
MVIPGCNDINPASLKCFPATWAITARPCDSCKSTAALLYCRPDSLFLCITCDAKLHHHHHHQKLSRHERVWICEVCEQAPASVTCKADAAALCITCDRDIHSANPLASRHERLPVSPFYDTAESILLKSSSDANLSSEPDLIGNTWLTTNTTTNPDEKLLDFDYPWSCDSVVPVQVIPIKSGEVMINTKKDSYFELDFSNPNGLLTPIPPTSVSSACLDAGVVPEGNSMCDTLNSMGKGMDREARVHRYREKRKNRRYDKMIRYASRKAYAESRPRIKGRFVKRTAVEQEEDEEEEMMGFGNRSSATATAGLLELMEAGGYGVVPSLF